MRFSISRVQPLTRLPLAYSVSLFAVALALWLINHPYVGVLKHDARIYSLLVLHWENPSAYSKDIFFSFGSQDSFSLFTPFYGALTKAVGLPQAAKTLVFTGALLWVAAGMALAKKLLSNPYAQAFSLFCLVCWALNYSPNQSTFLLNESFATARSLSFPLGIWAIVLELGGKRLAALICAVVSCLLHPLLGLWPLVLVLFVRVDSRWILVSMLLAAFCLAALAIAGWPSLQPMDLAWKNIVSVTSFDVLVGDWNKVRLNETLAWIAVLLWAGRFSQGYFRRIYWLTAFIGAYGFLLATLCSQFWPAVLLVQAQLWRAMWLAVVMGVFAFAHLLSIAMHDERRWWWALIGALLVSVQFWLGWLMIIVYILQGSLPRDWRKQQKNFFSWLSIHSCPWFLLVLLGSICLVLLPGSLVDLEFLGYELSDSVKLFGLRPDGFLLKGGLGVGLAFWAGLIVGGMRIAASGRGRFFNEYISGGVLVLALVFCFFCLGNWDQRTLAYRRWEAQLLQSRLSQVEYRIKPGEVVFWLGSSGHEVWMGLGTAHYLNMQQAIGIVFSRAKTFELLRRTQRLAVAAQAEYWPLNAHDEAVLLARYRIEKEDSLDEFNNLHQSIANKSTVTLPGLRYLCEDNTLDWVVVNSTPSGYLPAFIFPELAQADLKLYSCRTLRTVLPQRNLLDKTVKLERHDYADLGMSG